MNIHRPYLGPGAKPIFHRGSSDGCLCIHGFGAAPTEVSWLADHLHETLGMTTYSVRLAGHGSEPRHMRRVHWHDWYMSARDGYQLLADQCERVFVAGMSMGGLLSLLLCAAEDTKITAGAIMAAPVLFKSENVGNSRFLKWVRPKLASPDRTNLPQIVREEQRRRGEPIVGRTYYDEWQVSAVAQMYNLSQTTRNHLSSVNVPLILVFAEHDTAVPLEASDYIAQHVASPTVEQHTLHESSHIITQDIERETAFGLVEAFFANQTTE